MSGFSSSSGGKSPLSSQKNFGFFEGAKFKRAAMVVFALALLASLSACSEPANITSEPASASPSPAETASPEPTKTDEPVETPAETPEPTKTQKPQPTPTPEISFPPLATNSSGAYKFPQIVADRTSVKTGEPVYFKIVTSENVKSIRTVIDGVNGKIYTDFSTESGVRVWIARIYFTAGGNRKVQFRCTMTSGSTSLLTYPKLISVTFKYTAESTSKIISSGKTVTFTLKTPSAIDNVNVLVDGVKQKNVKTPDSDANGIKVWKINVTFFKTGDRSVTFEACAGTRVKATFPDPGIPIIVQ